MKRASAPSPARMLFVVVSSVTPFPELALERAAHRDFLRSLSHEDAQKWREHSDRLLQRGRL